MVMIPKRTQIKDLSEGDVSGFDLSEIERSRRFSIADLREPASATGSSSGATEAFVAIVSEFTASWDRGERPSVEGFLARLGPAHPDDIVELIYREFCLAESKGLAPDPNEYLRRFPDRAVALDRLLQYHGALSSTDLREWVEPEVFPQVGDEIGHYFLRRELGRGSFARVYLAEQANLDDRLVVLKISTRQTSEPKLLARARHSHIVEVLWHGSAEGGTFHLVCLPFLGGATLASVLAERRRTARRPKSGRDLLSDLDRVSAPEYPKANLARAAREIVERLSYPAAMAWVVARLAEALDHAFVRGVAHGDIKPSNILLTADGQPMLLDFNLAVGWRLPGAADLPADAGGTLAYMAPERLRAVAELNRQATPSAADRHRADIFALGIVLLETLTGRSPDLAQARARTRQEIAEMLSGSELRADDALRWLSRSSIPRGLRSILERCLAPDRADRYGRASELADDLDRWRTGRPLAFADEPPWRFRVGRWARRQRLALSAAVVALAVCSMAMTLLWTSFQTTLRTQAEDKLAQIWDREESGVFRFLRFGHWTPDDQGDPAENARRHLARYDVLNNPEWSERDDIRSLPEPERAELRLWLLEQILRYATALGDRPDSSDDWRRAQTLLDQVTARTPFGPFQTQRRRIETLLGGTPTTTATGPHENPVPTPLWIEEYLRGVEAEPNHAREALAHYNTMLQDRPHSFWGHYRASTVAYRLGDQPAAVAHLKECIAQRPRNVSLRAQLAACLFVMGQYDEALEACTQALEIDPDHAVSTRNQTYVRRRLGQEDRVNSDIRRYELLTRSQRDVWSLKVRLESMNAPNRDAMDSVPDRGEPFAASSGESNDSESRILRAARLRASHRFDEALLELNQVLAVQPDHLEARFYRATLLRKMMHPDAEAEFAYLINHPRLDELLPQYHNAIDIYLQRSTDLLRAKKPAEAVKVARAGLVQANRFKSMCGESHYALARAYAAAAKSDPGLVAHVIEELKSASAIRPEYLTRSFESDRYFQELRDRLRPLLKQAP